MPKSDHKRGEVLGTGAGLAASVALEAGPELGEGIDAVKARGYWEQVWIRLRRDKVAIGSAIFIVFLFLASFVGSVIAEKLLGHGPNDLFFDGVDERLIPVGPMSYVTDPTTGEKALLILGADSTLGRDEFLRLLYGGRVSLQVAILSTIGAMSIGVTLGAIAGYFRGWIDTIISRITEVTMAFPALLFIIALASTVGGRLDAVTFGIFAPGVITLVLVFTVFGWFYPARIIRAQVLSLREKDFVAAAIVSGEGSARIIFREILPNMTSLLMSGFISATVYAIGAQVGLEFLGLGDVSVVTWGTNLYWASNNAALLTGAWWTVVPTGASIALVGFALVLMNFALDEITNPRLEADRARIELAKKHGFEAGFSTPVVRRHG